MSKTRKSVNWRLGQRLMGLQRGMIPSATRSAPMPHGQVIKPIRTLLSSLSRQPVNRRQSVRTFAPFTPLSTLYIPLRNFPLTNPMANNHKSGSAAPTPASPKPPSSASNPATSSSTATSRTSSPQPTSPSPRSSSTPCST